MADLKGKTLAVDALTTGYAFVLYRMLEIKAQLTRSDYALDGVGGTNKRLDALLASSAHAAALLSPPFDQTARAAGMTFLGTATDVIGPYQASCLVARRAWLARNRDTAVRLARAVIAATAWMYDPANHDAAVAVLAQHTNQKPDAVAPLFASMTTDPKNGFSPTCSLDLAGMQTVLELRSTYGVPKKLLKDPLRYYAADIDRRARA
jgi:ABC-type nitrate/sulfonate/bicarbonate transport system substrate-binding protein